ncbi:MAG: DNA gyrase inhibitor YacG [Alphaproteobacteria bacterium]|nr:DNA gyrase inhibitor YacG [Alphaproteobacteria bacterium]
MSQGSEAVAENPDDKVTILKTRCPICRRPAVLRFRPFCSKHCADIDLARWVGGEYRIPVDDKPDSEQED